MCKYNCHSNLTDTSLLVYFSEPTSNFLTSFFLNFVFHYIISYHIFLLCTSCLQTNNRRIKVKDQELLDEDGGIMYLVISTCFLSHF